MKLRTIGWALTISGFGVVAAAIWLNYDEWHWGADVALLGLLCLMVVKIRYYSRDHKKFKPEEREAVWRREFGNRTEAKCPICEDITINAKAFHMGHIDSVKERGGDELSNIRPICQLCNLSMGSQNMKDYIKKNYPKNSYWRTL
jgi:hypothetical protein